MKTIAILFTLFCLVSCASHEGDLKPHEDSQNYEHASYRK